MSLTTINVAKEASATYQPLLLAQLTWADGFAAYFSSKVGVVYNGATFLPRILDEQITAVQALSEQGISLAPQVTLKLADADAYLTQNIQATRGFKGATMTLLFVFGDLSTNPVVTFSSDWITKFLGICATAQRDDKTITITATNKINLATQNLPQLKIQPYCPWIFPTTLALQQAAANGSNSQSKECPYNPAGSTNQLGNLNSATGQPYTSCAKTKTACQQRGMYTTDSAAAKPGRSAAFSGIRLVRCFRGNLRGIGSRFSTPPTLRNTTTLCRSCTARDG